MQKQTLTEVYTNALVAKGVSSDKIQFIVNLIKESDIDANAYIMENDCYTKLKQRGLLQVFEEVTQENHIVWSHFNEPER